MKKNRIIWIVIALIIIGGGAYAWKTKNKNNETNGNNNLTAEKQSANDFASNESSSVQGNNDTYSQNSDSLENEMSSPDEKRSDEKPDEAYRQQIIAYVNQNLNKMASPPANDKWDIPTIYFVGNSIVYVELYAVDTDLAGAKILFKVNKDASGAIKLNELARYKEGEEDWILASGKDDYEDYVMEEYDLDETTGKWVKTDEFTDDTSSVDDTENMDENESSGATNQILQ